MRLAGDIPVNDRLRRRLSRMLQRPAVHRPNGDEAPLRAEVFSLEQLGQHARQLAGCHQVTSRHGRNQLLARLAQNEAVLIEAYHLLTGAVRRQRDIAPAGEWLLDNFYLIDEQIRLARRHFPSAYSRELPRLLSGANAGNPRVYEIALELISHVDGRIDAESLSVFVAAYQSVAALTLGELWAVPIMLRLALLENLRRVAIGLSADRRSRDQAAEWAERMLAMAEKKPGHLIIVVADMVREGPALNPPFVAELSRQLQSHGLGASFTMVWLEQRLAEQGQSVEQLIQQESQRLAADHVSIGNTIGSLRFLAAMDWRELVETLSVVEQTLRGDPPDVYAGMDFATRDYYRHAVEDLARYSPLSEQAVAQKAVELARQGGLEDPTNPRAAHIGHYLIGEGRRRLERAVAMCPSFVRFLEETGRRAPLLFHLGAIGALSAVVTGWGMAHASARGTPAWMLGLIAAPLFVSVTHLSVALVNWISTLLVAPRTLPKMDFSQGIPPPCRTICVVPAMLAGPRAIDELVDGLEVRFLANRGPNIYFALLTDFVDAAQEVTPRDHELLQRVREGIERLNQRYADEDEMPFFLFHRPRRWNEQEGVWMGWERKRGKLADFNALLRGGGQDHFSLIVGPTHILPAVQYVITLDCDTELPRDAARQLVAAIAHPLNRAVLDPQRRRVVKGYAILQPRVGVSLPSAGRSLFAKLMAGDVGIDPYTRAVSDVYQDVFAEGSFIGKGIYEVEAFEQALAGRFPHNRILSHDLLEGSYARSGLLSDVLLYEDFPSRYLSDMRRRHRWIRGDWQIAPWILPRVPGPGGTRVPNVTSALSRWKMFDNLRRSLIPPAMVLLLAMSWLGPGPAAFYSVVLLGICFLPGLLAWVAEVMRKPPDLSLGFHVRAATGSAARSLGQTAFGLMCLPYEAYVSLDAVIRTTRRVLVSRRNLLQWQTAIEAEQSANGTLLGAWMSMWTAPAAAASIALAIYLLRPTAFWLALPVLAVWFMSPTAVWWLSRPLRKMEPALSAEDTAFLRLIARRTWRYFEEFVGPEDNSLPPDNFQEVPSPTVAHRTSATNMGIALLADLTAYDFGYISMGQLLERVSRALSTMERLTRHRGHLFNWYDTRTLQPLAPLYVSSVDSGNLIGHLLFLRQGLLELKDGSILPAQTWRGLSDTLAVLQDAASGPAVEPIAKLQIRLKNEPLTLAEAYVLLERMAAAAAGIAAALAGQSAEVDWWSGALERQCRDALEEMDQLAPSAELREAFAQLGAVPTLRQIAEFDVPPDASPELREAAALARKRARLRFERIERLCSRCAELADADFEFLYDRSRHLLSIGYNVSNHRLDTSYYDLLASEARFGSFVAISQGKLPQDNWFALSRSLTTVDGDPALISWSGSMFEYLMPALVMPNFDQTLLDRTYRSAVRQHIKYGRRRNVPWGISESAFFLTDAHSIYQYRAFGVPGLGLKRGLSDDLVIAPYATVMALTVAPQEACANLRRLAGEGCLGAYGFYEAVDYTSARLPRGQTSATVRCFMGHHQGMSLLALAYRLLDRPMQRRFHADPLFRSSELLLHERVPKAAPFYPHPSEAAEPRPVAVEAEPTYRIFQKPAPTAPEVHLLSNGRYHVMVTESGGGYSRYKDLAVTRWREDPTRDSYGLFIYVREPHSEEFWSAAHQPSLKPAQSYEALFSQARVDFRRHDHDIGTHVEISVSPEDDVEVRRVSMANHGRVRRTIELTSYAEVVLTPPPAEAGHPAFANLFVQTSILPERQAILCTRRPRSASETPPWMFHLMAVRASHVSEISFETDRAAFIGRGRALHDPAAMHVDKLSGSEGAVLDPIVAIRRAVTLAPEEIAVFDLVTGVADSRDAALSLIEKYGDARLTNRVFELAWPHSQAMLRQLEASESAAQLYGRLASAILYANPARRPPTAILARNRRGQPGLWGYGISGDYPIVLLQVSDLSRFEIVRQCVRAHAYWRMKGLSVDLVILNEDVSGYRKDLQDEIVGFIAGGTEAHTLEKPGGIFARRADQITEEDKTLLQAAARVVLSDTRGTLARQTAPRRRPEPAPPRFMARTARPLDAPPSAQPPPRDLMFFNGFGGFTRDGREYVITLPPHTTTPAPWVNVLANPDFGTVVSESGGAYTWAENAHEFRLTPWNNDPVTDAAGEAFYLRDEESGRFWSPAPQPARGSHTYVTRHGFGYSVFEYADAGIASEMCVFVAMDAPVKFVVVKLRNQSGRSRRLSLTGYVEWVLGEQRSKTLLHVVTEIDSTTRAMLARNAYNAEFPERIAFLDVSEFHRTVTGSRTEFLGRTGTPAHPAAMNHARLSDRVGAGLDPCGALQVVLPLGPGQEREVVFMLGAGHDLDEAREVIQRFRGAAAAQAALKAVQNYWDRMLGVVQIESPDPTLDYLVNGWLLYQMLSSRIFARTGFYQSSGAFGFRDQLQDVMALSHAEPGMIREHLLRCAARQFREGDVQHWWHPPIGRGIRTRISDDYLWLPYVASRYVREHGDSAVLDEKVHFLEGRPIRPDEEGYYDLPVRSEEASTLYDHCARAIMNGLKVGRHGLPLMGAGDWNDGMNLVGVEGAGESVWLAFFLHDVLVRFAEIAERRGDVAFAQTCHSHADALRRNVEQHAWDGQWYRRAYFDDGQPLGSSLNPECQIDALPQAWAALSGAADPTRTRIAMQSVDARLVRRDARLIHLLQPPFDQSPQNPGYIKGYVPGVRENGGQYTHAAIWTVMAYAALRDAAKAWELLSLINPIRHGATRHDIDTYKVEPYVVAADVYSNPQHLGRGGWTWYTGSAGWMYRLITESLLGLRRESDRLCVDPVLPAEWNSLKIRYRYHETFYHITIQNGGTGKVTRVLLDGDEIPDRTISLTDDRREHHVRIDLG